MYAQKSDGTILRLADGAVIPADPRNRHYADFLAWQAAGNELQPDPTPVPRKPRALPDLVAALQALTPAERQTLMLLAVADMLQGRPQLARQFNIALDGDEE